MDALLGSIACNVFCWCEFYQPCMYIETFTWPYTTWDRDRYKWTQGEQKKKNTSLKKHIPYYTIHRSIHHKYIEGGWFYLNLLQLNK